MKSLLLALLSLGLVNVGVRAEDAAKAAKIDTSAADKLGWQVGVHAYTFRTFPIADAIDKTAGLGVKVMSLSGSVNLDGKNTIKTHEMSAKDFEAIQARVKTNGLTLHNIGVVQLPADEAKSRKVFDFARKLGVSVLVSEPEPDALDTVEKLCEEYNIRVAIHNHPGPRNRYWHPDRVLEAIKGRKMLGACADTGHWVRSGLDPVECLKKLDGHVVCLHFKDLSEKGPKGHDVPWGTGVSNVRGMMEELKRQGFHGAFLVEYEYHWDNSVPEVAECVKFFNATCAELVASASKH